MRRAFLFSVLLFGAAGQAELPSFEYYRRQQSATEALYITIQSVRVTRPEKGVERIQWRARVDQVIRSRSGLKRGQIIRFEHQQFLPGHEGPANAPHLRRGQRTIAFLNRDNKGVVTLAKIGRSFEITPKPKD